MKIVIVICSLATFAIAVPVYQENVFESLLSNQASSTKHERKSAFSDTPGFFPEHGIDPIHRSKKSSQGTSLETKSFKRPIIIKRKLGYHVYRDSDEEMAYAEPGENCREQVKFKLCDHEPVSSSKNGFKSPTFKCFNNHNMDNGMENSIKMAKEAVEHLQKDLKRMENFSPKIANPHIEDIESNTRLHHDIEIAREALEHIEQNFESVNLEVNKAKELQISKSQDKERLTQWREAIENIHKNFEIVKNIEDAFKSDDHVSLFRSDSRKIIESEKPKHSEGHVFVQYKYPNDNLENNEDAYNEDKILKSASNEDRMAQPTPKTENVDDIGKNMENDMFVSPAKNRKEKTGLHSDSLKSDINNKDSFLRSDVSEVESTKYVSNVPKESHEYVPKKSLTEVPNHSEHEKSVNDHIRDDYKLLPKVSSSLSDSLDKNVQIEEQKTIDKSEWMMKTALPERDNKNVLIKMKSVKEILGNKKDQEKAATSNEENINEYKELFKSENENSPLERLSLLPSTNLEKTSSNIENLKNADAFGEDKIYSDKYNNKVIKNEENKSKSYNINMRLSNDQLEQTDPLSANKYVTIDQDVLQSPHLFSLKEKNALEGEENDQNEHKTHYTIKENHEFYDSLKDSGNKFINEAHNFKRTDDYKNIKSSEVQDGKIDSQMILNPEMNKLGLLNDDSVKKVDKNIPELYKTVSEASNENILNDRDLKNQHTFEEEMRIPITQNKDENKDSKLQFSKSVSELMMSMPTEQVDISDDQHSLKNGMRLSQTENEKLQLNEQHEGDEHLPTRFDIENRSFKTVPELKSNSIASLPTDKVEITNDQQSYREEARTSSSESKTEKMHSKENQELHEPLPIALDIERHAEERTWQSSKFVPELPYDPMLSMPTEKIDITDDQHAHKEAASVRLAESPNEKSQLDEIQEVYEPLTRGLDIESLPEKRTWPLSKSVPEVPNDPMLTMTTEKVDIIDDHHTHKGEESMRSAEVQNEKNLLNENQEVHEPVPMGLDIERHPEESTWESPKSVPELPSDSMQTEKIDYTDDHLAYKEETNMRSSDSQNEKLLLNEYQDEPKHVSSKLDMEYSSDDMKSQFLKSVPEMEFHPLAVYPTEKLDISNNRHLQGEEMYMRSAEVQNEKNLLNENQEVHEPVPIRLDIERHPEESTWESPKSVPELPSDSMQTEKIDYTDDHLAYKEETNMRSSDSQNEKLLLNEYQEVHEPVPMGLHIERHPEESTWESPKSVPELPSDSMQTEKIDYTDDHHAYKEATNMRSSDSQNEKLLLNEYQDEPKHVSPKLDMEYSSDDMKSQFLKSVPEMESHPLAVYPTEKLDISNNRHLQGEEMYMRSAEVQNEKNLLNENQEVHELVPMGLDIERHPEESTWESPKSVPELPSDSMQTEKIDYTDDHLAYKEETNMRSSDSQNEKLLLNEYQDEPKHVSSKLDMEYSSDDMKSQFLKSVPEMESHPLAVYPTEKLDISNNRHLQGEEMYMRSAEVQNEKNLLNENQEVHEPVPMGLDIERHPEESTWESPKSVPELPSDSMQTEKIDYTDDHLAYTEETNMRSSDSQNEKLLLNEYQDEPKHVSSKLDMEYSSDDMKSQFLKSVPEMESHPLAVYPTEKLDISNNRHLQGEEMYMRSAEVQNEKNLLNENQEVHEPVPMGLDIERHPEESTWESPKSVPELPSDSMQTEKIDYTDDHLAYKEETNMRSSDSQNEKLLLNEYQDETKHVSSKLDVEYSSDDMKSQFLKSVPEMESHPLAVYPTEKLDISNNRHLQGEEMYMRSAEVQNEKNLLNENQEVHEPVPMGLDIERHPEESTWESLKSVPELPSASMKTEKIDYTDDHYAHKEETNMRSSESQSEKLQLNEYQDEPKHASTKLNIENSSDDIKSQFLKSVPELPSDSIVSIPTEKMDITTDYHARKEEASMRSSESQSEKLQLKEYQEEPEHASTELNIENGSDDVKSQFLKSVPELSSDSIVSMPTEKVDITNDRHSQGEEESMRSAEVQNGKNQEVHKPWALGLDIERHPEERTRQLSKSVPDLPYDPMVSMPTEEVDIPKYHYSDTGDASIRVSETQNEKLQLNDMQEGHEPLLKRLDMTNRPEDRKLQVSKSVPELPFDPMVSMSTDKVEITNDQKSINKENMRFSQNQNEGRQSHESNGQQDFFSTKLGIENHPEYKTSQFFKSAPELSMTGSNIIKDARLSQNQNERQQIYFNQHLYEPHSSRTGNEKKLEDDSLTAHKVRFSYIQNPMKEETNMRLSQNQNENKEILYPSRSLGLSNEHLNREENEEYIINGFMHPSIKQQHQIHENRNPMLRSSYEKQHLNHNFKSWPEHKMLLPTSQFEFSNGQNVLNDHMRINEQQSRDPEPMENQNLHNSLSMRWNTANQHQDPSSETFKFNSDFDHTLHRSNEFDNVPFISQEVSKTANTLEYRTRPQLFGDHILDDTHSNHWYQTKQHNDHFTNYYKTIPEGHEEYMNPHFRKHLHRVALNHNLNDGDTFSSHDSPSNSAILHEHMQKYHQEKSSNVDSSMDPNMHKSMGDPFAKSGTEFNNMHFNHPHGTARFGAALPIAGVNSGAVGVFPTANAGGCGIPLLLSCSPSVVSGSLGRPHIAGPIFKSADENFKYYMKRDAKNIADIPNIKIQKASFRHNHGTETTSEI